MSKLWEALKPQRWATGLTLGTENTSMKSSALSESSHGTSSSPAWLTSKPQSSANKTGAGGNFKRWGGTRFAFGTSLDFGRNQEMYPQEFDFQEMGGNTFCVGVHLSNFPFLGLHLSISAEIKRWGGTRFV